MEETKALSNVRLLYSNGLAKANGVEVCTDVETWEDVCLYPYKNYENCIILVGPALEEDHHAYGAPGITFEQIHYSFGELIKAGLSKEEAITELLLFYGATPLLKESSETYGQYQTCKHIILNRKEEKHVINCEMARTLALKHSL